MKSFSENHLSDEAYLCAELIIEEKIKNFSFAKQRAFKAIKKKLIPSNLEIFYALKKVYQDSNELDHNMILRKLDETHKIMSHFKNLNPMLSGFLSYDIYLSHMPVELHLFTDNELEVISKVNELSLTAKDIEKRMKIHGDIKKIYGYEVDFNGTLTELLLFSRNSISSVPNCNITGLKAVRKNMKFLEERLSV